METTILSWNAPNWITVLLMVAVGFMGLGLGVTAWRRARGQ